MDVMDNCRKKSQLQLNNEGSALITVLIVVIFLTLIVSTMLYSNSMNYEMKTTDYQNEKSFYKAEEAMDVLREAITDDLLSDAFFFAYQDVMQEYAWRDSGNRQERYRNAFLGRVEGIWNDKKGMGGSNLDAIKSLIPAEYHAYFIAPASEIIVERDDANNRFVIRNVRVQYVQDGYSSYISADIAVCLPKLQLQYSAHEQGAWTDAEMNRTLNLTDSFQYLNWTKY